MDQFPILASKRLTRPEQGPMSRAPGCLARDKVELATPTSRASQEILTVWWVTRAMHPHTGSKIARHSLAASVEMIESLPWRIARAFESRIDRHDPRSQLCETTLRTDRQVL